MATIDLRLEGKAKVCIKGSARFFGLMMRVGGWGGQPSRDFKSGICGGILTEAPPSLFLPTR